MKKVDFNELYVGMRVMNDKRNIGIVDECDDIHNVHVQFRNGGLGFHCLMGGCYEIENINGDDIKIDHYDPLYHVE